MTSGRGCSGGACADSARCRNGGVRADSARCASVPSPSGGVIVAMALTRGTKIASKTKAEHLFGPERFRVEQTAKTSNPSLSSTSAPPKHSTHRNRHTVQVRRLLVGFARSVLVRVPLVVRE